MGKLSLSHALIDLGFFSALGTSEHPRIVSEEVLVKRGLPYSCDYNNGVTVVYDEKGRPWILRNDYVTEEVREALEDFSLKQGAYVPHSNDGGNFIHHILPTL